jgi:hypothetical protein
MFSTKVTIAAASSVPRQWRSGASRSLKSSIGVSRAPKGWALSRYLTGFDPNRVGDLLIVSSLSKLTLPAWSFEIMAQAADEKLKHGEQLGSHLLLGMRGTHVEPMSREMTAL